MRPLPAGTLVVEVVREGRGEAVAASSVSSRPPDRCAPEDRLRPEFSLGSFHVHSGLKHLKMDSGLRRNDIVGC